MDKNLEVLKSMRDELCKQIDALEYAIRAIESKKTNNTVKHTSIDMEETKKKKTNVQQTIFADPPQPNIPGYYEGGPGGICT